MAADVLDQDVMNVELVERFDLELGELVFEVLFVGF
jgi:hypothetical protein